MKKQNTLFTKLAALILIGSLLLSPISSLARYAHAEDVPVAPTAPTAPSAPDSGTQAPAAPSAPSAPQTPGTSSEQNQQDQNAGTNKEKKEKKQRNNDSSTDEVPLQNDQKSKGSGGNVGDTYVQTGDANNNGTAITNANANGVSTDCPDCLGDSSLLNSGNGADSSNTASNTSGTTNLRHQDNSANVGNNFDLNSDSGSNDSNGNVGDTTLLTGDANVSATAVTAVNTNVDGVAVAQFDIADDHVGDIVLDFGSACITGCGNFNASAVNSGNGSNSTNNATNTTNVNNATFQNNDAVVGNDMVLAANSGNNNANMNTGGDTYIQTGDANVSANMLTFANNNLTGNVVYGVVNIYGDLQGDILLPAEQFATVANSGNGSNSTNNATNTTNVNNATFQNNDATITNNLILDGTTGNNSVSGNTGGDSYVQTGNTSVDANVLNVANTNLADGTVWLVLVNEAGNWIGHIMGLPDGQNFAGSEGMAFAVGQNGEITASNNGNGANSTNNTSNTSNSNNLTAQNNTANVENNLNLSANTGGNSASNNTGGASVIKTGDAEIVANLVNFVNNNIVGNGKLVVTVVNVFGSWIGDFVTPGQKKDAHTVNAATSSSGSSESSTKSNSSNAQASNTTSTGVTNAAVASAKQSKSVPAVGSVATTGNAQGSSVASNGVNKNTAVLGQSLIAGKNKEIKAVTINLAWILLLLPIALIGFTVKTRLHRSFSREVK